MKTKPSPWTRFTIVGGCKAPISRLYKLLTTRDGIERWFLRKAEFTTPGGALRARSETIRKGDRYFWLWHGYPDSVSETGTILGVNGGSSVSFTFGGPCRVKVSLRKRGGISLVQLTQDRIPIESDPKKNLYVQCQIGWTFYLANLKSIAEGGLDLRNKRRDVRTGFK